MTPDPNTSSSSSVAGGSLLNLLYRIRIFLLAAAVLALMSLLAPREFPTASNMANIVRATSADALAAAGFTVVMLTGQLDLSIGATMTLGGCVVMFAQPPLGWFGAALAALGAGALVGLLNGLLVTRAKINSFIVTLGMMTILHGLTRSILQGGSKSLDDVATGMSMVDWLNPVLPWSPRVLLIFVPLILLEIVLRRTAWGRSLYLIGGNRETAWHAGISTDRNVCLAFVLSGALCGLGGAFAAMAQNTAMPNLGEKTLMLVVAAVIVGGTSMAGGRGGVLMSIVALFAFNALTNGLSYLGATKSVKLIAHGVVLATVIIYDAWREAQKNRTRGQRHELMKEIDRLTSAHETDIEKDPSSEETNIKEEELMQPHRKDHSLAIVCVTAMACVAIVAIFAMSYNRQPLAPIVVSGGQMTPQQTATGNPALAPGEPDISALRATDGQPLVWLDDAPLTPPQRPDDPKTLPNEHLLRWYDYEYAGWATKKLPMPKSPGDGPRGKKIVSLQYMDHPYWKSYGNGMRRLAEAYGVKLTIMEAGNDNKVQMDQVEQAIAMKPDMVILTPVDSNGAVPILKRLYDAGIPTIASNLLPVDEGMKYVITWTGPDDWGQFRMLSREFAQAMNNQGKYCIIRHVAGTSCYLSRTWAAVSELKKIAPEMECLDMQSTDLKAEKTKSQVAAWLKKYGSELKGIISADDSKAQVGITEALKDAGREDIICVAAGASRTGLTYIKDGLLHAITYQSAEADGALPIHIAALWFNGQEIKRPVYYLKKSIITKENLDDYWPPQW